MIINIGKCMDCNKKFKDNRNAVYEEITVDGRKMKTDRVIGYICNKCSKKRFSAFLISMIRNAHKRQRERELEAKQSRE